MTADDIRVLAGLLEAFAANDAEHCGGTEHRIQSANVMRALAEVVEIARIDHRSAHSEVRRRDCMVCQAIARVEALKP